MLAKDCLEEFKVECDLRRLSTRTTKSYYNSTALFLNFLDKNLQIRDLESIRPPHIKKYIQYLLDKKLSPSYINGILKCLRIKQFYRPESVIFVPPFAQCAEGGLFPQISFQSANHQKRFIIKPAPP